MSAFFKKLFTSPAFREILRLALAALAGAASSGCGALGLGGPSSPALDVYECQVAALETVVPTAVAEDLVMAARAGQFGYVVQQLHRLDVSVPSIEAVAKAYDACVPAEPPAPAEPEPVELLKV